MLQRRRVFDITNMITNYTFMVYVLICSLYLASFWFDLDRSFVTFVAWAGGILAFSIAVASAIIFVASMAFWIMDGHPRIGLALWSVMRGAASLATTVIIHTISTVTSQGIEVRL